MITFYFHSIRIVQEKWSVSHPLSSLFFEHCINGSSNILFIIFHACFPIFCNMNHLDMERWLEVRDQIFRFLKWQILFCKIISLCLVVFKCKISPLNKGTPLFQPPFQPHYLEYKNRAAKAEKKKRILFKSLHLQESYEVNFSHKKHQILFYQNW